MTQRHVSSPKILKNKKGTETDSIILMKHEIMVSQRSTGPFLWRFPDDTNSLTE